MTGDAMVAEFLRRRVLKVMQDSLASPVGSRKQTDFAFAYGWQSHLKHLEDSIWLTYYCASNLASTVHDSFPICGPLVACLQKALHPRHPPLPLIPPFPALPAPSPICSQGCAFVLLWNMPGYQDAGVQLTWVTAVEAGLRL